VFEKGASAVSEEHPGSPLSGKMMNLSHKSIVQFKIQDDQQANEGASILVYLGSLFHDC
jgi:hypothetical protein